jgi:hypothetical protein
VESIIITIIIIVAGTLLAWSFHRKMQRKNKKNCGTCGACDDKDRSL